MRTHFAKEAIFVGAQFTEVQFDLAAFVEGANFVSAAFSQSAGSVSFDETSCSGDLSLGDCTVEGNLWLNIRLKSGGSLSLTRIGTALDDSGVQRGAPRITFGGMSLAGVRMHGMDLAEVRFSSAVDIEKAFVAADVAWPPWRDGRPRIADEDDLEDASPEKGPRPEDVERAYRGIRKGLEDRGDRVGAHPWYESEMEVGRLYAPRRSFRRVARSFYKATSDYGLSAAKPALWLLLTAVIGYVLLTLPVEGICPQITVGDRIACVGWVDRLEVVLLAMFLQPPPTGIVLTGPIALGVWLLLRVMGAAMLVSIAVAFRNQIAR